MTPLVAEGTAATAEQADVDRRWADFVALGGWRRLIDDLNRLRRDTYADLTKLANTPEGKSLPKNFAERFFLRDVRTVVRETVPTIAGSKARIADLERELATERTTLTALEDEQHRQTEATAQRQRDEVTLTELQRQVEELKARLG
jgi:hypothetical protein